MVAPAYFVENRYSYLVNLRPMMATPEYVVDNPETEFERSVQQQLAEANDHLQKEEYRLALAAYGNIRWLLLSLVDPILPPDPPPLFVDVDWTRFLDSGIIDPIMVASATMLKGTPPLMSAVPSTLINPTPVLSPELQEQLKPFQDVGLRDVALDQITVLVNHAHQEVAAKRWTEARDLLAQAETLAPSDTVRAHLLHDLAVLDDKLGNADAAITEATESAAHFETIANPDAQFVALATLAAIQHRANQTDATEVTIARAEELRVAERLAPIALPRAATNVNIASFNRAALTFSPPEFEIAAIAVADLPAGDVSAAPLAFETTILAAEPLSVATIAAQPLQLITSEALLATQPVATLKLLGTGNQSLEINLQGDAAANFREFYLQRSITDDFLILDGAFAQPTTMVAYFPHLFYFVLPMAMGDCHAGMGDFARAEEQYLSVLSYPYLNWNIEVPKVWLRLADTYLDWGDQLYRQARHGAADAVNTLAATREKYERIVRADGTIDLQSPLYSATAFTTMRGRVTTFLAAPDPLLVDENPAIVSRVQLARTQLQQLIAGLNFFGFGPDYIPPFNFEYLQTTARYFAQQAAQVEQQYIQFKSQAENEEFRREQLDQQAEVARASVELEERNIAEAEAGIAVAAASVRYAETQRANAVEAIGQFDDVRWELLELGELEAWANAQAVDADDEVRLTIPSSFSYYNTDNRRRSWVIQDLARRRTRISHDLEAGRLNREAESAAAYKAVAEAQQRQAVSRAEVVRQRKIVAQLQQRFAEENRDFLDLQEFSARLWYDLAKEARRLARRYVDLATEIAFLAERAYFAETGRDLRLIKFDYELRQLNGLLAGARLLQDIDFFTADHVRTRSKKTQIKQTISIADTFPMAFNQLKQGGRALFETTLDLFDRSYPGYYLHKVRNVELVFVGLTNVPGVHGTLRNIGVSRFRDATGSEQTLVYPADVMPLSQYELRQDALAFRFNPNDLRLFENNGVATMWQLDLPLGINDLNFNDILDLQLVLYYDAFFSPSLETDVLAALPSSGTGSRGLSMRLYFPDELFFLRNQGSAEIAVDPSMFPSNQVNLERTRAVLHAAGDPSTVAGLTLRLESADVGAPLVVSLDEDGLADSTVAGSPLGALLNRSVFDRWTVTVDEGDNPRLVQDGKLDLSGLRDLSLFLEYAFDYRR